MTLVFRMALAGLIATASSVAVTPAQARSDASFMKKAAEAGDAEVQASQLVQDKVQRAEFRAFARSAMPSLRHHLAMSRSLSLR